MAKKLTQREKQEILSSDVVKAFAEKNGLEAVVIFSLKNEDGEVVSYGIQKDYVPTLTFMAEEFVEQMKRKTILGMIASMLGVKRKRK